MGLGSFEGCQTKKSWNQKILLAKIGADTAENERNFAENLPKIGNYPTLVADRQRRAEAERQDRQERDP